MKSHHLCSILLTTPLFAQPPVAPDEERGPFQAYPHFVVLRTAGGTHALAWKPSNDVLALNAVASGTSITAPRYDLSSLFGSSEIPVQFDAISSGNDHIATDLDGKLDPDADPNGQTGWIALTFSVTETQVIPGQPAHDGNLYSYFLPGSQDIPHPLIGSTSNGTMWLEQGHAHLGIALDQGLRGHDIHLPYIQNGASATPIDIHVTNRFFFSLTATSAQQCSTHARFQAARSSLPGQRLLSGADVFQMTWTPGTSGTAGSWSVPTILYSAEQLAGNVQADVDALAVDVTSAPPVVTGVVNPVMYSLTAGSPLGLGLSPNDRQLLVKPSPNHDPKPPRDRNNQLIRQALIGEVDALAVLDPEEAAFNQHFALPLKDGQPSYHLSLSIANDGPLTSPNGIFSVSVDGLAIASPGSTVKLQYSTVSTTPTWSDYETRTLPPNQTTMQWRASLYRHFLSQRAINPNLQQLMYRATVVSDGMTLRSWPVALKFQ